MGSVLPFDTTGIDFSMTALFVVIFLEQWLSAKSRIPALIGLTSGRKTNRQSRRYAMTMAYPRHTASTV